MPEKFTKWFYYSLSSLAILPYALQHWYCHSKTMLATEVLSQCRLIYISLMTGDIERFRVLNDHLLWIVYSGISCPFITALFNFLLLFYLHFYMIWMHFSDICREWRDQVEFRRVYFRCTLAQQTCILEVWAVNKENECFLCTLRWELHDAGSWFTKASTKQLIIRWHS